MVNYTSNPLSSNLIGQKFGKLTVTALDKTKGAKKTWACICECGNSVKVASASLCSGNTKSCGCYRGRPKDETGKRYGRLLVICRYADNPRPGAFWLCECDCGKQIVTSGNCLRSGGSKSCGCQRTEKTKERNSLPYGVSGMNRAIANMKSNAVRRNIKWALADNEVIELMAKDCHYCGIAPMQKSSGRNGSFLYNGLDRVDNSKGYISENVVTCCVICNNSKNTMSVSDFLTWISRVYTHTINNKS